MTFDEADAEGKGKKKREEETSIRCLIYFDESGMRRKKRSSSFSRCNNNNSRTLARAELEKINTIRKKGDEKEEKKTGVLSETI